MFGVITITWEFGSGGGAIARSVAQRLGWKVLDKNLVEAVARAAQVALETARRYDEGVDSWWHRINRAGLSSAAGRNACCRTAPRRFTFLSMHYGTNALRVSRAVSERRTSKNWFARLMRSVPPTSGDTLGAMKDPHLYHMMINPELGRDNVVRLIVDVVEGAELAALLRSVKV